MWWRWCWWSQSCVTGVCGTSPPPLSANFLRGSWVDTVLLRVNHSSMSMSYMYSIRILISQLPVVIIRHICWVEYWFCPIHIFYVICHNIPHTPYARSPIICVTTSHWPPTHPFDVCTPIQSRSKMCNNSQVKRTCGIHSVDESWERQGWVTHTVTQGLIEHHRPL